MTDKQIKISKTKRYCGGIDCAWCDEKEPCIYKIANELEQQLKRKEQEYNKLEEHHYELEEKFLELNTKSYGYILENDQLKKENEELKEINSKLLEHRKHSATCQECYKDGLEDGLSQNKTLSKYKQALTEIKEIAYELTNEEYTDFIEGKQKQILQKISEVIDD